jgi:hypothetical protein
LTTALFAVCLGQQFEKVYHRGQLSFRKTGGDILSIMPHLVDFTNYFVGNLISLQGINNGLFFI